MLASTEAPTLKAGDYLSILLRQRHSHGEPHGVDAKSADNTGVQAFEVQYQYVIINPRRGIEHISTGATHVLSTGIGCDKTRAVQTRQV